MPYQYLDDIAPADVAFQATGSTVDAMFLSAAEATVNVMTESPEAIRPLVHRDVVLESDNLELLLVLFLQEVVFFKDADNLLLCPRRVAVRQQGASYKLKAVLDGEAIDPGRHRLNVDIKAVTLHGLRVVRTETGWQCQVVLDI